MHKRKLVVFLLLSVMVIFAGCSNPSSNVSKLSDEAAIANLIEKFSNAVEDNKSEVIKSCFVADEIVLTKNNEDSVITREDLDQEFYGQYKKYAVDDKMTDVKSTTAVTKGKLHAKYSDGTEEEVVVEFGVQKGRDGDWKIDRMKKGGGNSGGGKNGGDKPGLLTLTVNVDGLSSDINMTLIREGEPTTVETITNEEGTTTATFEVPPTGDPFYLYGDWVRGHVCYVTSEVITEPEHEEESEEGAEIASDDEIIISEDDPLMFYIPTTEKIYAVDLEYREETVPVTEIVLNRTSTQLLEGGDTEQLSGTLLPLNATLVDMTWSSSNEAVATVGPDGLVTSGSVGQATITASIGEVTAECAVEVVSIPTIRVDKISLDYYYETIYAEWDPELIPVNPDEEYPTTFTLTATILPGDASNKDVVWYSSDPDVATVEADADTGLSALVTGKSPGTVNITVETIDGNKTATSMVSVIAVPEVELIYPVEEDGITPSEGFDTPLDTYINIENLLAAPNFSKVFVPGSDYITYYLQVREQGSINPLGEGEIKVSRNGVEARTFNDGDLEAMAAEGELLDFFNLYLYCCDEGEYNQYKAGTLGLDEIGFDVPDIYSTRCFMDMSTSPDFPAGDDETTLLPNTLTVNFTIEDPVPTVPKEDIHVYLNMLDGSKPDNVIFLLCRELDEDPADTTWEDYLDLEHIEYVEGKPVSYYTDEPYTYSVNPDTGEVTREPKDIPFTDEVKVLGKVNSEGQVEWEEPKETIKIGGYFLIEITPNGYMSNLNNANPEEDDALLKEVHLMRDEIIERTVTNTYVGE